MKIWKEMYDREDFLFENVALDLNEIEYRGIHSFLGATTN